MVNSSAGEGEAGRFIRGDPVQGRMVMCWRAGGGSLPKPNGAEKLRGAGGG